MIDVRITKDGTEVELAHIRIERVGGTRWSGNYSVEVAVNRGKEWFGLHQRGFDAFPRGEYNVLALVKQALETLEPKELELEGDVSTADMEREVRGALPPLSGEEKSRVRNHRPSFWRR